MISVNIVPGFSKQQLSIVKVKVSPTHSCSSALKRACLSVRASAVLSTINEIRQNNVGQAESNNIRLSREELVAEWDCGVLIQRVNQCTHFTACPAQWRTLKHSRKTFSNQIATFLFTEI